MNSPALSVLLFVAVAAGVLPATAQSGRDDEAAKVTFKVTRFDVADRPPPEFELRGGVEPVSLKVPLTYIAGPFKAPELGMSVPICRTVHVICSGSYGFGVRGSLDLGS